MKLNSFATGILSFMIVLLLMPIGHALMILNEHIMGHYKLLGAFIIGFVGLIILAIGIVKNNKAALATILGLLGGILIWTGWIEFSFVWIAEKLKVSPLMKDGEITTKPEYLVMLSSLGLLMTFIVLFMFSRTKCTFFNWFQRIFKLKNNLRINDNSYKPYAVITFIESIMIIWTFYLVLLIVYDDDIAGDFHPATYIVAFGSLIWSLYLLAKLLKINKFDYSIRYAVPTVIIFWNFIEILGRWEFFDEVWVQPVKYQLENGLIVLALIGFIIFYIYGNNTKIKDDSQKFKKLKNERTLFLQHKKKQSLPVD